MPVLIMSKTEFNEESTQSLQTEEELIVSYLGLRDRPGRQDEEYPSLERSFKATEKSFQTLTEILFTIEVRFQKRTTKLTG